MEVFDDLISAIQEAVIRAHETSEQQHVRMMSRFFDSDTGEPKTLALNLPFLDPGNSEIQLLGFPHLALGYWLPVLLVQMQTNCMLAWLVVQWVFWALRW